MYIYISHIYIYIYIYIYILCLSLLSPGSNDYNFTSAACETGPSRRGLSPFSTRRIFSRDAKRKTNLGKVIGQRKKFAAKRLDQPLLFYFFTARTNSPNGERALSRGVCMVLHFPTKVKIWRTNYPKYVSTGECGGGGEVKSDWTNNVKIADKLKSFILQDVFRWGVTLQTSTPRSDGPDVRRVLRIPHVL